MKPSVRRFWFAVHKSPERIVFVETPPPPRDKNVCFSYVRRFLFINPSAHPNYTLHIIRIRSRHPRLFGNIPNDINNEPY